MATGTGFPSTRSHFRSMLVIVLGTSVSIFMAVLIPRLDVTPLARIGFIILLMLLVATTAAYTTFRFLESVRGDPRVQ